MILLGVSIGSACFFIFLALFGMKVKQVFYGSRLGRALARHPLNRGMTVGISHESLTWDNDGLNDPPSFALSTYRARDDSNASGATTTTTVFVDDRGEIDTSVGVESASQNVTHANVHHATVHATESPSPSDEIDTSADMESTSQNVTHATVHHATVHATASSSLSSSVTSSTARGEPERKISIDGRGGENSMELTRMGDAAAEVEGRIDDAVAEVEGNEETETSGIVAGEVETSFNA